MEELKKCPFCGGEAKLWSQNEYIYYVSCEECECCTPAFFNNMRAAIDLWNKRVE